MIPVRLISNLLRSSLSNYLKPPPSPQLGTKSEIATVNFNKDKFVAVLEIDKFQDGDVSVEIVDNAIVVTGNKYVLPKGYYDLTKVESKLSSDGILEITAPKRDLQDDGCCKKVEVVKTGRPYKKYR